MATTYLTRTFGTATNRLKGTFSFWVKRSAVSTSDGHMIFNSWNNANYRFQIWIGSGTDQLGLYNVDNSSANMYLKTTAQYRDVNGWYHIYYAVDTTQSTSSDRIKLYVNGERITSFTQETYPAQNADMSLGASSYTNLIGKYGGGGEIFNGSMSHYYFVDGSVIDVGQFGSTDSTTGEWKINTNPTISSYGNQGFLILKDGNTITDQSPNSNNFTVGAGTLTKTEDNPSNVFATLNSLDNYYTAATLSNGNTSQTTHAGNYGWNASTLGMTSGKFYVEMKQTGYSGSSNYNIAGITSRQLTASNIYLGQGSEDWGYYAQGNGVYNGGSFLTTYASWTTNDIIGIALDLDNNKLYFSKNGTWQNNGVPTSGSTGTGAISITANKTYFFASGEYGTSLVCNNSWNFGNGFFGTTAVASAGTNASNNGIFEYDVPAGYTALSTKGLNT